MIADRHQLADREKIEPVEFIGFPDCYRRFDTILYRVARTFRSGMQQNGIPLQLSLRAGHRIDMPDIQQRGAPSFWPSRSR